MFASAVRRDAMNACAMILLLFIGWFSAMVTCEKKHQGHQADWNYASRGPRTWPGVCQYGKRQSPIDIDINSLIVDRSIPPVRFSNYKRHLPYLKVANNGHGCQIDMPDWANVSVSGGGLPADYDLVQVHFHWRASRGRLNAGSEHTINGLHHPVEAHFVHAKRGLSVKDALKHRDGLAVIAVFFSTEMPAPKRTPLKRVIPALKSIRNGENKGMATVALDRLLPNDRGQFFRYYGSLTTPNCTESVIWTIFVEPIAITFKQLEEFGKLVDGDGNRLANNFRPTQPLDGRKVWLRLANDDHSDEFFA